MDVFMEFPLFGLPDALLTRSDAGAMSNGRRGTSEEGKDGERAGENRPGEGSHRGDDGGGGRGSRSVDGVYGDVGGGAESAVCVVGAVGVDVRDLNEAEDDDQQDTEEREEDSPGSFGARLSVVSPHSLKL
jgi:hypothetical protein